MFKPITFDEQLVKSKNDGGLYGAVFTGDGILWGCGITATADSVTFASGEMILGGRVVAVDGSTTVEITNPIQDGYARIKARIDLSKPAAQTGTEQFETVVEFSTTALFPELAQEAVNDTGKVYEQELAVVKIEAGNVTGVTRRIGQAAIDAEKLGGQLPGYYAKETEVLKKSGNQSLTGSLTLTGSQYNAHTEIRNDFPGLKFVSKNGAKSGSIILNATNTAGTNELVYGASTHVFNGNIYLINGAAALEFRIPDTSKVSRIIYNASTAADYGLGISSPSSIILEAPNVCFNKIGTTTLGACAWLGDASNQYKILRVSSLRKLKTDIEDVTEEDARKAYDLRPRSFKGINKGQDDFKQYGFVAEEVEETVPELATYDDGKLNGVMYDRIPALLLKQNQMQKKEIEGLKEEIKGQKAENSKLKALLVSKGVCTQKEIDNL